MSAERLVLTPQGLQSVRRWHLGLAAILAALVLFLPGLARFKPAECLRCGAAPAATAPAVAPTPAATPTPSAAPAAAEATASPALPPVPAASATAQAAEPVALYYASGAWSLPPQGDAALAPLVAALKARPTAQVVISGFHDARGDAQRNRELAFKRARAVAQALQAAGVDPARIDMVKPQQTTGGTDPAQARRVEVSLR